jgi:hypothetical protein
MVVPGQFNDFIGEPRHIDWDRGVEPWVAKTPALGAAGVSDGARVVVPGRDGSDPAGKTKNVNRYSAVVVGSVPERGGMPISPTLDAGGAREGTDMAV